ncbi:hypothetical protein WDW37_13015 [Bdellovibrionota bacterium FG-1]
MGPQTAKTLARLFFGLFVALICGAAGPCASDVTTRVCATGGSLLSDGTCSYSSDNYALSVPAPVGVAPSTAIYFGATTDIAGAGVGYIVGGGVGFSGPNSTVPLLFGGGKSEVFTALASYPSSAPSLLLSDGTSLNLTDYIVAAGYAKLPSGSTATLIARYTPLGALDTSFNNGKGYLLGSETGIVGGTYNRINAVAIDSKGRIVVVGEGWDDTLGAPDVHSGNHKAVVARLLASGALDTTGFHASPLVIGGTIPSGSARNGFSMSPAISASTSKGGFGNLTNTLTAEAFTAVIIGADDEIYAAGYSATAAYTIGLITKFQADGLFLGKALGNGGTRFNTFDRFNSLDLDSSGRVVAVGYSSDKDISLDPPDPSASVKGIVIRYAADLSVVDSTFNSTSTPGYWLSTGYFGGTKDSFNAVAIDPNDNIFLGGYSFSNSTGNSQALILKIPASGTTVLGASTVAGYAGAFDDSIQQIVLVTTTGSTTEVLGVGVSNASALLTAWDASLASNTAFNANATPSGSPGYQLGSFAQNGVPNITGGDTFLGTAITDDGTHIVVAGFASDGTYSYPVLVRYLISTGALD